MKEITMYSLVTLFFFIVAIAVLCGCSSLNRYFGLEDDNPIEEAIEELIRYETGIDIDLTPGSPEYDGD